MNTADLINFLDSAPVQSQRHATLDKTVWSKLETCILEREEGEGKREEIGHLTVGGRKLLVRHEAFVVEPCFAHEAVAKRFEAHAVERTEAVVSRCCDLSCAPAQKHRVPCQERMPDTVDCSVLLRSAQTLQCVVPPKMEDGGGEET